MNNVSHYKTQLNEIFPRENYKKSGKENTLQFLIALKQKDATIIQWLDEHPEYLNTQNKNYRNLTPLFVAVMQGNAAIVQKLLDAGASPVARDYKQWTPLHHAAVVGDQDILSKLIHKVGKAAAAELKTMEEGTYLDIQVWLAGRSLMKTPSPIFWHREGQDAEEISSQQFKELTKAEYNPELSLSKEGMAIRWADRDLKDDSSKIMSILQEKFESFLQTPPPKISFGNSPYIKGQFDVFAEDDIKAFQPITIYGGEFTQLEDPSYYFLNVDGRNVRNLGPMINDGFPNTMIYMVSWKGLQVFLFIAIRPIKKGETLTWNYGKGAPIKDYEVHLEGKLEELEQYAKSTSLDNEFFELQELIKKNAQTSREAIEEFRSRYDKLSYFLDTPSTWIYFLSNNTFPNEALSKILSSMPRKNIFFREGSEQKIEMLKRCCSFHDTLKKQSFELQKTFRQVFSRLNASYPANVNLSVMGTLLSLLSEPEFTSFPSKKIERQIDYLAEFTQPLINAVLDSSKPVEMDKIEQSYNTAHRIVRKHMRKNIEVSLGLFDQHQRAQLLNILQLKE